MILRPMTPPDEPAVRALFAQCHPRWAPRATHWYVAYPTLVAFEDDTLVGFTSFAVTNYLGTVMVCGQDLCVLPIVQHTGVGWALHTARCEMGAEVGARMFTGLTAPENKPMIRIFERCGYHACHAVPGAFPDGNGVIYLGDL